MEAQIEEDLDVVKSYTMRSSGSPAATRFMRGVTNVKFRRRSDTQKSSGSMSNNKLKTKRFSIAQNEAKDRRDRTDSFGTDS